MTMPTKRRFNQLTIASKNQLTPDSVALSFDIPDELLDAYRFVPGQYLTLRATIAGRDERRSYSICSSLTSAKQLQVGIKQVEGGVFSNYACNLSAGQQLNVMTPQGNFQACPGGTHDYLLFAAGSGITPCLSIVASILELEPDSHVTLFFGNRTTDSMMFRGELSDLKDRFTDRFLWQPVMSAERQDAETFNGRITGDKIRDWSTAGIIDPLRYSGIYCCGPHEMINEVCEALQSLGVAAERVHFELFTSEADTLKSRKRGPTQSTGIDRPAAQSAPVSEVSIVFDGTERVIQVAAESETVLAAATRSGLDLPFSCQGGMCCTCRCRVVEGQVAMDVNFSLAQWEIDAGYTLACQARPQSETVALDFDAI